MELRNYCESILSENQLLRLACDHDESDIKPPELNGCIPDLFLTDTSISLIGEAKTIADYQTNHSMNQYIHYINFLKNKKNPHLIFSCRKKIKRTFSNMIDTLMYSNRVDRDMFKIIFLEKTNL